MIRSRSRLDAAQLAALQPQSLLIVKLSSIGDVVHALPVASALRGRYPRARITWAVEDWAAPIVIGHRAIDRVVVFPRMRWGSTRPEWLRSFVGAVQQLRGTPYDISIDLQGLLKSAVVAMLSRAPVRIGAPGQREGSSLISQGVRGRPGGAHVVEDYLQCAHALGAAPGPVSFDLPIQPQAVAAIDDLLSTMGCARATRLIVINPSASASWKTWPMDRWIGVATALAKAGTVVLVGSPAQRGQHAAVARQSERPIVDLTGRTTLAELIALLDRCAVHIAPDTGSAHIAAALGRPVVGLYGPTSPRRSAPYGYQDLAVYHPGQCALACPRWCWRARRCLQVASPDEVVARARAVLERIS